MIQIAEIVRTLAERPHFIQHFMEFAMDNILYLIAMKLYTVVDPEVYNAPIKRFFRKGVERIKEGVKKYVYINCRGV